MEPIGRPLDSERINSALKNSYWRVRVVDVTGSTQNDLAAQIRQGNSGHGAVLVSEFQSAGRGRMDRTFLAPSGSALLFSFFIELNQPDKDWGWLALLAGQAAHEMITSRCTLASEPTLKWPNDLLINEKKVAGILSERVDERGVIIGIGINVDMSQGELPVESATSLALQGCSSCDRNDLLIAYLEIFAKYLVRWQATDTSLLNDYKAKSSTIGREIAISAPDGSTRRSTAIGIDSSGALVLTGEEILTVGDVIHLHTN